MITRRVVVNLVVFALATAFLVGYGTVTLLGNPLRKPVEISAVLPTSSGLYPHFSVTLNGVDVGSVSSVKLTRSGARVTMALDPGARVPANVAAKVNLANDLGEQQVDLVPLGRPTGKTIANGAVVPVAGNPSPAQIGAVVQTATRLLDAIPKGDLNTVLRQASAALQGRVGDMRQIILASRVFSAEMLQYQQSFRSLLANSPPVLNAVTIAGPELRQALSNTSVLASVLAKQRYQLVDLFSQGAHAAQDVNSLLVSEGPNLGCLLHDAAHVTANIASAPNLVNLDVSLAINQEFFGAIGGITPTGPAKSLYPGDPGNPNQEWIRVRLYIPGKQPSALAYAAPTALPPVKPGAGCSTVLGNGVGPATQPGFQPAGPGGRVDPAPARESVVQGASRSGTGSGPGPQGSFASSVPASYRRAPYQAPLGGGGLPLLLLLFGLAMIWLLLSRCSRLRRQRLRPAPPAARPASGPATDSRSTT